MGSIKQICFVVNRRKGGAAELAQKLAEKAASLGAAAKITDDYPLKKGSLNGFDVCFVIGGDGTILGIVEEAVRADVPVIGINLGKLGFMATLTPEESFERLSDVLQGKFITKTRALLQAKSGEEQVIALNDIVIKASEGNLLTNICVFAHGKLVNRYRCDGLIVSTPTGSTAYNLSAGGPIIHPSARVLALTPICPHTLTNRTVIFDGETELEIREESPEDKLVISLDGRSLPLSGNPFPLKIQIHPKVLSILLPQEHGYFNILRSKLNW